MKSTMRKRWLVFALIATIGLCASPVMPFREVPDLKPKK
jgi:hypothetical protein